MDVGRLGVFGDGGWNKPLKLSGDTMSVVHRLYCRSDGRDKIAWAFAG